MSAAGSETNYDMGRCYVWEVRGLQGGAGGARGLTRAPRPQVVRRPREKQLPAYVLRGPDVELSCVAWSGVDGCVAVCGDDCTVRLWREEPPEAIRGPGAEPGCDCRPRARGGGRVRAADPALRSLRVAERYVAPARTTAGGAGVGGGADASVNAAGGGGGDGDGGRSGGGNGGGGVGGGYEDAEDGSGDSPVLSPPPPRTRPRLPDAAAAAALAPRRVAAEPARPPALTPAPQRRRRHVARAGGGSDARAAPITKWFPPAGTGAISGGV